VLLSGIAAPHRAVRVAESLLAGSNYNGWGIRTIDATAPRYNPMSYHNGSVWPHDNALVAMGFGRYHLKAQVLRIFTGLFNASVAFDLHRLPELFCGFDALPGQGPTLYPVACSPQAWSSGTAFMLLQAAIGLEFQAEKPQLRFNFPVLPEWLQHLEIRNLRVGTGCVDLQLQRHARDVSINVTRKEGDVEVAVII
jgi:glycogen debranching enzyme